MSDLIPFDMQSKIIERLPVKSLIQFRSVSKQWMSFIDNPKFIKNYHVNHTNPQYRLLVQFKLDNVQRYSSIIDNNTFPQQKFPLTAPESLSLLTGTLTLGSVNGLLCFCGLYREPADSKTKMAVIWNPTIRKSVGIVVIPKAGCQRTIVGFGVCPDTSDPKLVKICVRKKPTMWEVEVFTLSTRFWKTVYMDAPFKSCDFLSHQVFVNGVIYFLAIDQFNVNLENEVRPHFIISFDLRSEKFGEVRFPEGFVHTCDRNVTKLNESLGLLGYYYGEGYMMVCDVWMRRLDGANNTFSKMYTVQVQGFARVLEFRNNGEVVIELAGDDDSKEPRLEVYEHVSRQTNRVGINGQAHRFSASSYMETLLLLDESDSVIH